MRVNEAALERTILAWLSATSLPFSNFLKSSRQGHVCLRSGFLSVLPSSDLRWGSCSSCRLCQAVIYMSLWEGLLQLYGIGNGTVTYICYRLQLSERLDFKKLLKASQWCSSASKYILQSFYICSSIVHLSWSPVQLTFLCPPSPTRFY